MYLYKKCLNDKPKPPLICKQYSRINFHSLVLFQPFKIYLIQHKVDAQHKLKTLLSCRAYTLNVCYVYLKTNFVDNL